MHRTPGAIGKTVLLIMLVMMTLRASLGMGYQVMFAVQHEHTVIRHVATGNSKVTLSQPAHGRTAQVSHACCFQFTMVALRSDAGDGLPLVPVWHARVEPPSSSFIPDRPHKPPKRSLRS